MSLLRPRNPPPGEMGNFMCPGWAQCERIIKSKVNAGSFGGISLKIASNLTTGISDRLDSSRGAVAVDVGDMITVSTARSLTISGLIIVKECIVEKQST